MKEELAYKEALITKTNINMADVEKEMAQLKVSWSRLQLMR